MAQNFIQCGEKLTLTAPTGGVESEGGYLIGALFVVAEDTAAEGDPFTGNAEGVFELPKATGYTVAEGDVLYWDVADAEFNSDTANEPVAIATAAAGSSATKVYAALNPRGIDAASALTRLDGLVVKQLTADGTQKAMTSSDTYVNFTEDALSFSANAIEDNDTVEWEALVKVDGMNAAGLVTLDLLCGSLSIDTVAVSTADTGDWLKLAGTARFTAVGASSTLEVFGGEGCGSDGGLVTRDTPTYAGAQSGPATTSAVVFKLRIKAATGNAANLATVKNFKVKLHKAA